MPVSGGAADKLGNRYEALWAVDQLLRIVDGSACSLTLEPLDSVESRGIEFIVGTTEGTSEYWSIKRQTTKVHGWSLPILTSKDDRGRSILGDLLAHVERDSSAHAVFASTLGARDFQELRAHAESGEMLEARLKNSGELSKVFNDHVLPLCDGNMERAIAFLRRTRAHAADEAKLADDVNFKLRKLLYNENGSLLDVSAAKGHLTDLLQANIHSPLDREKILSTLRSHGLRIRDWSLEKDVRHRIEELCESYVASLNSHLVNGEFLQLPGAESLLDDNSQPVKPKVLIVGEAGGGKSTTLAALAGKIRERNIPVLPIRFDQLPEGILSTTEWGRKLLLPESPALTLAGFASGKPAVLVVDQLDAISIASGRRAELWSLFEDLLREVEKFPGMSLLVGCREFDLEHDHRMRGMKVAAAGFEVVKLKPLTQEQVAAALSASGTEPSSISATLKSILAVPLYLSMYLSLTPPNRIGVVGRDDLFDRFWREGERRVSVRLGRKAAWTQVIDKLANWLSQRQQLSAPRYVLDEVATDAQAMASEHILSLTEDGYRFFHETFFDYAFARRFVSSGRRLLAFLLEGEQHLFRRGQVRQILAYLRLNDRRLYLEELESLLSSASVRFHIKSLVFQWLSALADPQRDEWKVIEKFLSSDSKFRSHARGLVMGRVPWFDVLDTEKFFDEALASKDSKRQEEAIWMLSFPEILRGRSARVATLVRQHRDSSEQWHHYQIHLCRHGNVYHSREMFDLFLDLIDDGTLDGLRPGFAVNDTWWSTLYSVAKERPDLACEVIGRWLDRSIVRWRLGLRHADPPDSDEALPQSLNKFLNGSGSGDRVVRQATQSPLRYAEEILPRLAKVVAETCEDTSTRLKVDPLWTFRSFGDPGLQTSDALLSGLAKSLEELARTAPDDLDRLLEPYQNSDQDTIVYLLLRAWTAAPHVYAERLADFLTADSRRLQVGYLFCGAGGGSAAIYTSKEALRVASALCTFERFAALEKAILSFSDDEEAKHPPFRGQRQLELLKSLDGKRLSDLGRSKVAELQRKFPQRGEDPPPRGMEMICLGSPISQTAEEKMTDENWLQAMRKYAGQARSVKGEFEVSGGEHGIATSLQARAKQQPERFISLSERMRDDLPASYFDAILRGVADYLKPEKGPSTGTISQENITRLVRRVHSLPGRPCGRWLAHLVEKAGGQSCSDEVVDGIAWYAINDPDPESERWRTAASDSAANYSEDLHNEGINSTRGAIAGAIAALLFAQQNHIDRLNEAARNLINDRTIIVRSCAIEILVALAEQDTQKAISWFMDCISVDPIVLATPYVENFVRNAGYRDFTAISRAINLMLDSASPDVVEAAARQACILALDVELAESVADRVRGGTSSMRKAAARVYATNVSNEDVGAVCRHLLKPFFSDSDEEVRAEASLAFGQLSELSTRDQADLLTAFLDSAPGQSALGPLVWILEESPVQLPDLVCSFAERCVDAYRVDAGDIQKAGAGIAMYLSKIVVRLYAQTEDKAIQERCLNLIDEMEEHGFTGVRDELRQLDR